MSASTKRITIRGINSLPVWISITYLVPCLNSGSSAALKILQFSIKKHKILPAKSENDGNPAVGMVGLL